MTTPAPCALPAPPDDTLAEAIAEVNGSVGEVGRLMAGIVGG